MLPLIVPQLTYVDFLEALARLACVIPIPSDSDMEEVEVMTSVKTSAIPQGFQLLLVCCCLTELISALIQLARTASAHLNTFNPLASRRDSATACTQWT